MPFIEPPVKMPFWVRFLVWIGDRAVGKRLTPPRVLAWYPKALVSSGIFEGLITHKDRQIPHRLLQLIRMQVSFAVSCPFCIDMNSQDFQKCGISDGEVEALQGSRELKDVASFSERERTALEYVRAICRTPIAFEKDLVEKVKNVFSEREMVIIASTAAQVNYWTRLIQSFGIAPDGFSGRCEILKLDRYTPNTKGVK
jgi:alkylhydroperoxidase family enzyme